jgi:DNA polymerase-4
VIEDLTKEGRGATRVHLKVRFAPFFTHTKVRKLPGPTMDPAVIAQTALALFDALADGRGDDRPVRLLGVRAEMEPPEGGY